MSGRLRRADCSAAGIHRRRRGRGFSFEDADGTPIIDEETLRRIRDLVIPPAWKAVWICGHARILTRRAAEAAPRQVLDLIG